ncbi:MAG: tRNA dihydrouridine synthase DusB [Bacilli bacterium]|nr:tRNA dihydrouridine synthase DusB [Bacilli bacterium]
MKWKIGNVEIDNQVCLAPMAGISHNAFRTIIKEMGCGLIYTEMISDKAIMYKNEKTLDMLYIEDKERPVSVQIFGSNIDSFKYAAKYIYDNVKPDIIDINMGCPVPKVAVKSSAGAALLKDLNKIKEIVSAVVATVPCPVTVKIRSGWDQSSINAVEVAKAVEEAGASAICLHPRTRSEGYEGKSDWSIIKEVKENVNIPVIGNGDIKSTEDAKRMLDETGCDAVMVGRGTLGNPWLIKEIVEYLENGIKIPKPTFADKVKMCLNQLERTEKLKGNEIALLEIRSHAAWYLKGLPNASYIKREINKIDNIERMKDFLNQYILKLENNIL